MIEKANSALQFISSESRELWVQMAMALKSEFSEEARDIWLDWSRQSDKFNHSNALSIWKSCRGSGIGIGTLYHAAKANGWRDDTPYAKPSWEELQRRKLAVQARLTAEDIERQREYTQARKKAGWIISKCKPERHAYLQMKGYAELEGLVWRPDDNTNLLCIPMRIGTDVHGMQMIGKHGVKKFIQGQRVSGLSHCFDNHGVNAIDVHCEGYATALSVKQCMTGRYRIYTWFSASNLQANAKNGIVIADNDKSGTGERAAVATGLPYWISDVVGEDFNDYHQRVGHFKAKMQFDIWLMKNKGKKK
jgi:putative DNA primase/helicase